MNERRREPRQPASGWVELLVDGPEPSLLVGELVDRSEHGFRVEHKSTLLSTGMEVSFRSADRDGRARVMWTRIDGTRHLSGFLIC